METKRIAVWIAAACGFGLGVFNASALHEVSASVEIRAEADFYAPLEAHGVWVEVESYGRCWHPAHVEVAWRPYCAGYWVWTDCGWYWVSDEPWSWACYHYGRWVYHPRFAWVWVPGVEWGSAWVSWRVGGGYVGWAPLPPRVEFRGDVIVASRVTIAPERFVFVEANRFHERVTPKTIVVNNKTVIEKTTFVTNIKRSDKTVGGGAQKVVVNEGPGLAAMQKATSQKVRTAEIREVIRQTPHPAAVTHKGKPDGEPKTGEMAGKPGKGKDSVDRDIGPPRERPSDDGDSGGRGKKRGEDGEKGKGRGPKKH